MAAQPASNRGRYLLPVAVLTLLAFGLRMYRLGHQSLWFEEGFSVWLAQQDLAAITTGDFNPPLYTYLLHFWLPPAGQGELAVRFPSLLFGVFTVPLVILLGGQLFDRRTGLVAGFLVAVAPLHVWYAQEARMYAMVTALSLLASVGLLWALQGRRRCWLLYLVATLAAVYTHYYAWMVVAAQAAYMLWWVARTWGRRAWHRAQVLGALAGRQPWPRPPRPFVFWLLSQIVLALAVVPWVPYFLDHYRYQNASYWPGQLSLAWVAQQTLTAFAAGETLSGGLAHWSTVVFVTLMAIGCIGSLVRDHRPVDGIVFSILYIVTPLILLYLIVRDHPGFSPRYLMIASPAFFLLAAAGLVALWPRRRDPLVWQPLGATAVLGTTLFLSATAAQATANIYFDPTYAREDFRGLARYLEENVGQDEGVLLLSGHFFPVFQYYYQRDNWMPIPKTTGPAPSVLNPVTSDIAGDLDRFAANRKGLWVVLWQDEVADPNGVLLALLDRVGEPVRVDARFHGLRLRHYRLPPSALFTAEIQHPLGVSPIPQVRLAGYDLLSDPTPADQPVDVLLHWQALAPMNANYRVSLRLRDDQGLLWASEDGQLAGFRYPTYRWSTGEVVLGRHPIPLPAGTLPGEYNLEMVFYAAESNMNPVELPLGRVTVTRPTRPPTVEELSIPHPLTAFFGGLELMGYDIVGRETTPGGEMELTLFWRAHQGPGIDRQLRVRLGDSETSLTLSYPVERWRADDIFRTRHRVRVLAQNPGGVQSLQVVVLDSDGQAVASPVRLTDVTVAVADRRFDVPADISHHEYIELGTGVTFLGYDIRPMTLKPGDVLHLTLYWQARARMDTSYKVFTHLLNVGIGMWGQVDRIPVNGSRPTTGWLPGEVIIDRYDIPVDPAAPAGDYVVEVGMYQPETLERLPAIAGGQRLPDDRILLEVVRVQP